MSSGQALLQVHHPQLGVCDLIRIEGTDWIVCVNGREFRLPAERRIGAMLRLNQQYERAKANGVHGTDGAHGTSTANNGKHVPVESHPSIPGSGTASPVRLDRSPEVSIRPLAATPSPGEPWTDPAAPAQTLSLRVASVPASPVEQVQDPHEIRRFLHSLSQGLPAVKGSMRSLAVGFDAIERFISTFLHEVDEGGGGAAVLKGAYGQGKTFALRVLEEIALEQGYLVARTEVDATENRLNKPHHIYRSFMKNLRVPGTSEASIPFLVQALNQYLDEQGIARTGFDRQDRLRSLLQCRSLAWLLSDHDLLKKPSLLGLLECDPNCRAARGRGHHRLYAAARDWPEFTAGTQGDFGSYLLSGWGKLARLLGYRGLILVMDEMEKWQDLNWNEQTQAGNLLGGLIWAARTPVGERDRKYTPRILQHSLRCGGYPFTTNDRCHIGLAIAMTPRSEADDPGRVWSQYGLLLNADLPTITPTRIQDYCRRLAPLYAIGYGFPALETEVVQRIATDAIGRWRQSDSQNARSAVQSVLAAFTDWRGSR